jgi:hypothetical protein
MEERREACVKGADLECTVCLKDAPCDGQQNSFGSVMAKIVRGIAQGSENPPATKAKAQLVKDTSLLTGEIQI